jgi:hypothetical protein
VTARFAADPDAVSGYLVWIDSVFGAAFLANNDHGRHSFQNVKPEGTIRVDLRSSRDGGSCFRLGGFNQQKPDRWITARDQ